MAPSASPTHPLPISYLTNPLLPSYPAQCVSSVPDCQTGIAASQASTHSFICKRNIPAQAQSILSGQFCYGTKSAW